jgi:hypothetical protein
MKMQLLDQYKEIQNKIFDYFGYVENWKVFPLDDSRNYFWKLDTQNTGIVKFAETKEELENETGQYYENEIYTQRHLSDWVYRGEAFTMIVVDTHSDGNKFLQIFANINECK